MGLGPNREIFKFGAVPLKDNFRQKKETMETLWVPGVNQLGGFGRWHFAEFCNWASMEEDFASLVDQVTSAATSAAGGVGA